MKVVGFFGNIKSANDAVEQLKSSGFDNAFVDMNEHYIDDRNIETNLPGTEMSPSLSGLILESDAKAVDRSKAPLTANSPMVSGIGKFEEIADVKCKVIVETDQENSDRVKKVLGSLGGELENPNVRIPKRLEDVDI